ncbi:MAG: hypothetical protein WEC84_04450 [Candidatus Andersenbacteria bacterium]
MSESLDYMTRFFAFIGVPFQPGSVGLDTPEALRELDEELRAACEEEFECWARARAASWVEARHHFLA